MANITVDVPQTNINVNVETSSVTVTNTTSNVVVSDVATIADPTVVRNLISVTDTGGDGSLSYSNATGIFTYTGPSQAEVIAHFSNVSPINLEANGQISINDDALFSGKTTDDLVEGTTNKYFTTTGATVNTDALTEGTTNLYLNGSGTTDDLAEGSANLWYTNARFDTRFSTKNTDNLSEGSNLYYTTARANSAISAYTGALTNLTGNITTTGIITAGASATDTHIFTGNIDVTGNVEVSGNLNYRNVEDLYVRDQSITLNANAATDATVSIIANRPQAGSNTILRWDETDNKWEFTNDGSTFYDIPTSTTVLAEGTNLYFTTNRANINSDAWITTKSTTDLAEGTNLYYTQSRFDTAFSGKSTTDLSEGTNLYYTTDRANSAIGAYTGGLTNLTGNITTTGNIDANSLTINDFNFTGDSITLRQGATTQGNANIIVETGSAVGDDSYLAWRDYGDGKGSWQASWQTANVIGNQIGNIVIAGQNNTFLEAAGQGSQYGLAGYTGIVSASTYYAGFTVSTPEIRPNTGVSLDLTIGNSSGGNVQEKIYLLSRSQNNGANVQNGVTIRGVQGTTGPGTGALRDIMQVDGMGNVDIMLDSGKLDNANTDTNHFTIWNQGFEGESGSNEALKVWANSDIVFTGALTSNANITTTANIEGGYIIAGNDAGGDGFFIGDINGAVQQEVNNNSGVTLARGAAVYLTGGVQGDTPNVALANAENAAHMPAVGIVKNQIADGAKGEIVTGGQLSIGTHSFTIGSQLYINGAGALTETVPTGEGNLVQKIAKVVTSSQIIVQGAGRTNATPNLDEGNIFLGDTNNLQRTVTPSTNFVSTGNVFDLSNTITGVNSITTEVSDTQKMTLNANAGLIINQAQATDNILADSANIDSDGYGFLLNGGYDSFVPNYTYSGSAEMFAIKFAGTITKGSPNIVVTDVADSQSAFPGNTAELANVNPYMSYSFTNNTFGDVKHFPRNAYVQSVDTGNNIITMSENATANATLTTTGGQEGAVHAALVNTNTGAVVRFASAYDAFAGSKTQIVADVPYINPDAYGYGSSSGIRIADYTNASSGSLSDYTCNTAAFAGTMHARQQLVSPGDYPKFADGLVIGKTTNLTNRAEFDVLSTFGLNMMWDGRESTGNPSKIPQYLLKSYTDNTLAATSAPSAGPRLFFTSAFGNADNDELSTYPRQNQELGRLTWWGTSGTNTGYSTTNPPAYISVQARDDWSAGGSRHGGNVDMYFAAAADHNSRADVFLTYDKNGRMILGSGGYNDGSNADISFGQAQTGTSGNPHTAYGTNPELWGKINYVDPANTSGSMISITNGGRAGSGSVGEMMLAFDRINNTSNIDISAEAWGNGQTITDIDLYIFGGGTTPGTWANNVNIAANSLTYIDQVATSTYPDGTALYLSGATGDVNSSSLNGATYYTYFQGSTGDNFYTLYTDQALTTEALYTVAWSGAYAGGSLIPFETGWNGTLTQTISGGVTDKKWHFKLAEQSDNLELFEDDYASGSGAIPHTRFDAGGNLDVNNGNVTLSNGKLYVDNANGGVVTNSIQPTGNVLTVNTDGNTHITTDRGVDGQPIVETGYLRLNNAKFDVTGAGFGTPVNMDLDQGSMFAFNAADAELGQINENDDGRTGRIVYPAAGSGSNVLKYVTANTNLRFGNTSGSTVTPFDGTFGGSNTEYNPTNASVLTIEFTTYNGNAYVTSWSSVET